MPDKSPTDFLSGMSWGQRWGDYNQMMPLQKQMQEMEVAKEREDLNLGAPVRQAERLSKVAGFNADASTVGRRKEAETGTAELALSSARQTQSSDVGRKIAENTAAQGKAGLDAFKNSYQFMMLAGKAAQSGPLARQQIQGLAQQMGIPPQMVQAYMADPKTMMQHFQEADVELQNKLRIDREDQTLKNKGTQDVANTQATSAANVANITGGYHVKAAEAMAGGRQDNAGYAARIGLLNNAIAQNKLLPGFQSMEQMIAARRGLQEQAIAERTGAVQQQQQMAGVVTKGAIETPGAIQPPQMAQPGGAQQRPQLTPQQTNWIQQAKRANPGMTDEQIIAKGKQLGYL